MVWRAKLPYRLGLCHNQSIWQTKDQSLRSLLLDTGRLSLLGWEFVSTPFANSRPSETGRATAAPLPSGGCAWVGLQLTRKSSCCATRIKSPKVVLPTKNHLPFRVSPVTSVGNRHAVQQQRKRWKVRGNKSNAALLRLEALARLISCRVTPCYLASASRTAG